MREMVLLFLAIHVSGCATGQYPSAQQQYAGLQSSYMAATKAQADCAQRLRTLPVYARLNRDFILEANDPEQAAKLANKRHVNESQARDIREGWKELKLCDEVTWRSFSQVDPRYTPILVDAYRDRDHEISRLLSREVTVGELNMRVIERSARMRSELSQLTNNLAAHFAQKRQAEAAPHDATAAAAFSMLYQLKAGDRRPSSSSGTWEHVNPSCIEHTGTGERFCAEAGQPMIGPPGTIQPEPYIKAY